MGKSSEAEEAQRLSWAGFLRDPQTCRGARWVESAGNGREDVSQNGPWSNLIEMVLKGG